MLGCTPRVAVLLAPLLSIACAHPAERALEGRWRGASVENFDDAQVAAATGWARGTELSFRGRRVTIAVPAEEPRTGSYALEAIDDRKVTLSVLGADGEQASMQLIVDDERTLRWVLAEGRTVLMKRL
jgi:hypothetical protein